MTDRANPIDGRHGSTLVFRYGHEGHVGEVLIEQMQIREIKTSMQRCYRRNAEVAKQRELQKIGMEVNDVKLVCNPPNALEHHDMIRNGVQHRRIKPQGTSAAWYQPG